MGRTPSCRKVGLNRGPWTPEEDLLLINSIQIHGEGRWRSLSKKAGLLRCGKSCRLRWMNYLRPDVKRGDIMPDEEDLILKLHRLLGNRWSLIAGRLPGRTDNDIKNYWNSHLSKKLIREGIDPRTHRPLSESEDIWWNPLDSDKHQQILQCSSSRISENVNTQSIESQDGPTPSPRNHDNANHTNFNKILELADMVRPSASCNELSNTNCAAPTNSTFCGFPYSIPSTPTGTANSYVHSSFLESFINEEFHHDLQGPYTTGHNEPEH